MKDTLIDRVSESKEVLYEWDDVSFTLKEGGKQILRNSSGFVRSGEMIALIGSSGAGKTTLLNVLGMKLRCKPGELTGDLRINGEEMKRSRDMKKISAYLRQEDFFHPNLTPFEVLKFALDLKSDASDDLKKVKIENILKQLNILNCRDTKIGSELEKGISGGERRRLSLAIEILNDPKIIFLDEPTSGLDSFSALLVMSILKQQARRGRIVICSLHQPSYEILDLIDRCIVLNEGQTVFNGNVNKIVDHVKSLDSSIEFSPNVNPIECLLLLINNKKNPESEKIIENLIKNNHITLGSRNETKWNEDENERPLEVSNISYLKKFWILMKRNFQNVRRSKKLFLVFNIQMFFSAILALLIYKNVHREYDNVFAKDWVTNMRNRVGSFFFVAMNVYISSLMNSCFKMEEESQIIYKEVSNGAYSPSAYFWSKSLMDFLFLLPPLFPLAPVVLAIHLVLLLPPHAAQLYHVHDSHPVFVCYLHDWKLDGPYAGEFGQRREDDRPVRSHFVRPFHLAGWVHSEHWYATV